MLDENLVYVKDLDLVWPSARPLLQKAIDFNEGDFDADHVLDCLKNQTMQLFIGYNKDGLVYAGVTEIIPYQKRKALRIILIGGKDIDSWVDTDIFERFGRLHGCDRIEAVGRKGWIKKMQARGYKQTHFVVTKDLKNE